MNTKFRTLNLAISYYKKAEKLKFKKRCQQDQFDRALLSIVLNLSEGSARPTTKDRHRFYCIALGSLREVQVLLLITDNCELLQEMEPLAASLYCLCRSLK